eukprot:1152061-Pelagomonas_calceolata.AAC.2
MKAVPYRQWQVATPGHSVHTLGFNCRLGGAAGGLGHTGGGMLRSWQRWPGWQQAGYHTGIGGLTKGARKPEILPRTDNPARKQT